MAVLLHLLTWNLGSGGPSIFGICEGLLETLKYIILKCKDQMNNTFISIGSQCTTPLLFFNTRVKGKSLPFDWIISTPEFVYTILKLMFIDNTDIDTIVDDHFFVCDKKALSPVDGSFITDDSGGALINSKYSVCFIHDALSDREKYIRRMNRLKETILDKNKFLNFVYVSTASSKAGNYLLDGVEPIQNLHENLEKISKIISGITLNYRIIVFDTHNRPRIPSDRIFYFDIESKNQWGELMPELVNKFRKLRF
jgi:hypothetical protein